METQETEYYKKLLGKYKFFRGLALAGLWLSMVACLFWLARRFLRWHLAEKRRRRWRLSLVTRK